MTDIDLELSRLVRYGIHKGLLCPQDAPYTINRLLSVLDLSDYAPAEAPEEALDCPAPILGNILEWAAENGRLESNTPVYRDLLDTELMACLTPRPSEVIRNFENIYKENREAATDYYYALSCASNYIRKDRVSRDIQWKAGTKYGDMVITINLSKPEKDPKAIAAALRMPSATYPKCLLCRETEGYRGTVSQPPRGNHRLLPLSLNGEVWYLQYSPYVYYNEHCILLNGRHTPMKVTRASFQRLLEFVTLLPHYFVGSNADLPIVGGSILTHDHFQGGRYDFPMAKAGLRQKVAFAGFPGIEAGLVDWPMSVIRLKSTDKAELIDLCDKILSLWRNYSDESVCVLAYTGDTPHNTITPICRFRDDKFEMDLVLRNNRTTDEHPMGLFHPHAQYHHIKKENIGLIEVMGLAILPARLKSQLKTLEEALVDAGKEAAMRSDESMREHLPWFEALKRKNPGAEEVKELVEQDIGRIFSEILENAGVYKTDAAGNEAFLRFIDAVNAQ